MASEIFKNKLEFIPSGITFSSLLISLGVLAYPLAFFEIILITLFSTFASLAVWFSCKKFHDRLQSEHRSQLSQRAQENEQLIIQEQKRLVQVFELFKKLNNSILPIWANNLNESRVQTENAITALTMRFKRMISKMEGTIEISQKATEQVLGSSEDGDLSLFNETNIAFKEQSALIHKEQKIINKLIREFRGLAEEVDELEITALDLAKISGKTQMLALNASIEASRSGETGAGFGVVADGIEELSVMSADTSKALSDKIVIIADKMKKGVDIAEDAARQNDISAQSSKETLKLTLSRFDELTKSLTNIDEALQEESNYVKKEISEVIIYFQFSDRVSQVLNTIKNNMESLYSLASILDDSANENGIVQISEACDSILRELESGGMGHLQSAQQDSSAPESEVTFF